MGDVEEVLKKIQENAKKYETKEGMLLGKKRFLLEEQLDKDPGTSGSAVTKVFKARDLELDEIVAVKCVKYGPHLDAESIERFKREAEVLSNYHHPNVVNLRYYDKTERHRAGDGDGDPLSNPFCRSPHAAGGRRGEQILLYLKAQSSRPVSRRELLQEVWGYTNVEFIETRTVDIHIAKLRRKIELDPANPSLLVTVRGEGYLLRTV